MKFSSAVIAAAAFALIDAAPFWFRRDYNDTLPANTISEASTPLPSPSTSIKFETQSTTEDSNNAITPAPTDTATELITESETTAEIITDRSSYCENRQTVPRTNWYLCDPYWTPNTVTDEPSTSFDWGTAVVGCLLDGPDGTVATTFDWMKPSHRMPMYGCWITRLGQNADDDLWLLNDWASFGRMSRDDKEEDLPEWVEAIPTTVVSTH
ncbi:hypothetical protein KGF54_003493 [Candida jiufengensis]|uniref:uncharacterized protein n=1 Tax=Candida jiufengensis TaxID=497108 RepID=UPI0022241003|nr:uncharacterized protein KGF54_003493 [Candida jiufengensis]KAI5952626.1 hypothetical protein KGF54_003493 [Candida jiufengensis]